MDSNSILNEQRVYALVHNVPILRESEVRLFEDLIDMYRPTSILEIGTAIGYSTLLLAEHMDVKGHITSIELDTVRYEKAKEFLSASRFKDQITLLQGDATEIIDSLQGPFDMVFLDGPKGQYTKQLQKIIPILSEYAVVLADNVLFRGYVEGKKDVPKRYKTIVARLREYLEVVCDNERFNTTIYPMGDGMSVSVWKGNYE